MRDSPGWRGRRARVGPANATPPSVAVISAAPSACQLGRERGLEAARARREKVLDHESGAANAQNGFSTTSNTTPISIGSAGISLIQR